MTEEEKGFVFKRDEQGRLYIKKVRDEKVKTKVIKKKTKKVKK